MRSLRHWPGAAVSDRLLPYADPRLCRVWRVSTEGLALLEDPETGERDFAFSQPVHVSRLIQYDLCELEDPIDSQPLGIPLRQKDGTWLNGSVVALTSTGAVRFQPADGGESQLVRLEHEEYQWARLATTQP